MWILSFLPDFIFHLITIAGVLGIIASFFFGFIPFVSQYKLPIQVVSVIVLAFGLFMEGAISNENAWQLKVKELEAKVAKAEALSQKENVKIVEKIITKTQIVKEQGQEVIKYIDRELVKYDNQCVIPQEFIKAHNDAVGGAK